MKHRAFPAGCAVVHCLCLAAWPVVARAEPPPAAAPRAADPAAEVSPWSFRIEPYGWAMGLKGTSGAKGFTAPVDVPFKTILEHLNWAAFVQAEARYGRFGLMLDGYFADLSDLTNPPGPLYSGMELKLQQGIAEAALAYRLIEGRLGWVDVFAGARYNYMGLEVCAQIDDNGVRQASERFSRRVVETAGEIAEKIAAKVGAAGRAALEDALDRPTGTGVGKEWIALLRGRDDYFQRAIFAGKDRPEVIREVLRGVVRERRALISAIADQRLGAVKATAQAGLDQNVKEAEQRLAKAVERELKKRLPENIAGDESWVDPFVGMRGQLNITRALFLAARGDVGGFGVSSDLVWQAAGSVGLKLTRNLFVEAGYRFLSTDFTDGGFTYDLDQSGAFMGLGITF